MIDEFPVWSSETSRAAMMWISLFLSVRKWLSIWLCCIDDRLIRKSDCLSGSICCCSFADALGFTLNLTSYNNFAQWRYSNQWSNREVLLLLVENYTQYPALTGWNTLVWGNFWRLLRKQIVTKSNIEWVPQFHFIIWECANMMILWNLLWIWCIPSFTDRRSKDDYVSLVFIT